MDTYSTPTTPNHFSITVDYSLTLMRMIAAGCYDLGTDDITPKRFPVHGQGKHVLMVELVHFDEDMPSDDAVSEIFLRGLRPATIIELLTFGVMHPEEQQKFPIVALGSVGKMNGDDYVPVLYGNDGGRALALSCCCDYWHPYYRFLAVKKLISRS